MMKACKEAVGHRHSYHSWTKAPTFGRDRESLANYRSKKIGKV